MWFFKKYTFSIFFQNFTFWFVSTKFEFKFFPFAQITFDFFSNFKFKIVSFGNFSGTKQRNRYKPKSMTYFGWWPATGQTRNFRWGLHGHDYQLPRSSCRVSNFHSSLHLSSFCHRLSELRIVVLRARSFSFTGKIVNPGLAVANEGQGVN